MNEVVFIVKKRGGGEHRLMRSPWKISKKVEPKVGPRKSMKPQGQPTQGCEA